MQKILFIFLLVITTTAINAQTIYHYQKVANVKPDTGEKTAYYGNAKLHCIFSSNGYVLQEVHENGVKYEDFKDGFDPISGFTTYYSGNRNSGEYSFVKKENSILTYKHYSEKKLVKKIPQSIYPNILNLPNDITNTTTSTFYIYLSEDRSRLNHYRPALKQYNLPAEYEGYELYDTDEASSIPKSKKMDPNNPTMLY